MTIQEAWKRILEIRGEKLTTCVTIELWHYSQRPGETNISIWLWDGEKNIRGKNLEDLIKLAEVSVGEPGMIDGELPETTERKEGHSDG